MSCVTNEYCADDRVKQAFHALRKDSQSEIPTAEASARMWRRIAAEIQPASPLESGEETDGEAQARRELDPYRNHQL